MSISDFNGIFELVFVCHGDDLHVLGLNILSQVGLWSETHCWWVYGDCKCETLI